MTAILGAITALATIVSGFIYAWKRLFPPTSPAQTDAGIEATEQQNEGSAQQTGRPQ